MSTLSSNAYADAYVDGRLAGEKFYRDEQNDPKTARPNNGYAALPLAAGEWERGFAEGYQAARSARPAKARTVSRRTASRHKSGWSLARLLTLGLAGSRHAHGTGRSSRAR